MAGSRLPMRKSLTATRTTASLKFVTSDKRRRRHRQGRPRQRTLKISNRSAALRAPASGCAKTKQSTLQGVLLCGQFGPPQFGRHCCCPRRATLLRCGGVQPPRPHTTARNSWNFTRLPSSPTALQASPQRSSHTRRIWTFSSILQRAARGATFSGIFSPPDQPVSYLWPLTSVQRQIQRLPASKHTSVLSLRACWPRTLFSGSSCSAPLSAASADVSTAAASRFCPPKCACHSSQRVATERHGGCATLLGRATVCTRPQHRNGAFARMVRHAARIGPYSLPPHRQQPVLAVRAHFVPCARASYSLPRCRVSFVVICAPLDARSCCAASSTRVRLTCVRRLRSRRSTIYVLRSSCIHNA